MTRLRGTLAILLAASIWGGTFPLIKAALADITPLTFNGIRFGAAAVLLLPALRRLDQRALGAGVIIGGFLSIGFAVQTIGLETISPSRSAFLTSLYAPLTPLVAMLLGGPRPDARAIAAVATALGGTLLLTGAWQGWAGGLASGDWLTVLCALCFAIQIVMVDRYSARHSLGSLQLAQVLGAGLVAVPLAPLFESPAAHWTPLLIIALVVEVLFATLLCLWLQLAGQRVIGPTQAAVIFAVEPVVAAAASRLTLGEGLEGMQWVGAALILVALLLPGLARTKDETAESPAG